MVGREVKWQEINFPGYAGILPASGERERGNTAEFCDIFFAGVTPSLRLRVLYLSLPLQVLYRVAITANGELTTAH